MDILREHSHQITIDWKVVGRENISFNSGH